MKTGVFAFFVMLAIVFSYEVAFGDELSSTSLSSKASRADSDRRTAENELLLNGTSSSTKTENGTDAAEAYRQVNTSAHYNTSASEGTRRESASAIKGHY